ncbi:hypothetical protein ABIB66_008873, partial [Bradyrhizobium sp. F1.13.3]
AHDNLRGNHYFAATLTRHPDCRAFPSRSTRYSLSSGEGTKGPRWYDWG